MGRKTVSPKKRAVRRLLSLSKYTQQEGCVPYGTLNCDCISSTNI